MSIESSAESQASSLWSKLTRATANVIFLAESQSRKVNCARILAGVIIVPAVVGITEATGFLPPNSTSGYLTDALALLAEAQALSPLESVSEMPSQQTTASNPL